MQDMMKMYGMADMGMAGFSESSTLVLNANHALVRYILDHKDGDKTDMFCKQLYDLALISHEQLAPEAMTEFIRRSNEILMLLTK